MESSHQATSIETSFIQIASSQRKATSDLGSEFWETHYQEGTTRWDLGMPAPPIVAWLTGPQPPPPGKAIVLGSGRGYEALLFAAHGFEVTAVDFAPSAIAATAQAARDRALSVHLVQRDIFELVPEWVGQFDYVVEHTCFCALDPGLRSQYVDLVASLLKPEGELLALFFTHTRPGGPPYGSTPEEIRALFAPSIAPKFKILALHPTPHSVPSRQGEEHIGHFQRC